jgi:hypothetical protein
MSAVCCRTAKFGSHRGKRTFSSRTMKQLARGDVQYILIYEKRAHLKMHLNLTCSPSIQSAPTPPQPDQPHVPSPAD